MLAAALEDGSLGLFDTAHSMEVRPRRTRMLRYHALLHSPPPPAGAPGLKLALHLGGLLAGLATRCQPWQQVMQ